MRRNGGDGKTPTKFAKPWDCVSKALHHAGRFLCETQTPPPPTEISWVPEPLEAVVDLSQSLDPPVLVVGRGWLPPLSPLDPRDEGWGGELEIIQSKYLLHLGSDSLDRLSIKPGRIHGRQH